MQEIELRCTRGRFYSFPARETRPLLSRRCASAQRRVCAFIFAGVIEIAPDGSYIRWVRGNGGGGGSLEKSAGLLAFVAGV